MSAVSFAFIGFSTAQADELTYQDAMNEYGSELLMQEIERNPDINQIDLRLYVEQMQMQPMSGSLSACISSITQLLSGNFLVIPTIISACNVKQVYQCFAQQNLDWQRILWEDFNFEDAKVFLSCLTGGKLDFD